MKDKYYTPEIEEFGIGFEFESNYITYSRDNEWVKVTLGKDDINYEGVSWFYSSYIGDAVPTEFRVKHLDREDIESLGFEEQPNIPIPFTHRKIYNDIDVAFLYWFNELGETRVVIDCGDKKFSGVIKNKSELKKILKMIGV